jgi:putative tryptophan/tyrosine transport system substrate-binding protein
MLGFEFPPAFIARAARERPDTLFVHPDRFFINRAVQFATLAARDKIPAAYPVREMAAVGGLMSYGDQSSGWRLYGQHP